MVELTAVDREDESKGKCLVDVSGIVMIREYERYCIINQSCGEEIYVASSFTEIKEKLSEFYADFPFYWLELNKVLYDARVKRCLIKSKEIVSVFEYPNGARIDVFNVESSFSYTVVTDESYAELKEKFRGRIAQHKELCKRIKKRFNKSPTVGD